VLLSNGEYNVRIIGVNWPHHVFVSAIFKVVGAEWARRLHSRSENRRAAPVTRAAPKDDTENVRSAGAPVNPFPVRPPRKLRRSAFTTLPATSPRRSIRDDVDRERGLWHARSLRLIIAAGNLRGKLPVVTSCSASRCAVAGSSAAGGATFGLRDPR
jgi:hypothetical protein